MHLPSATDLAQWAERRSAQADLPHLVRRLVDVSNPSVTRLSVPSGEQVSQPGWDGLVEASASTRYVPEELSAWEVGVGKPGPKAAADYRKRTEDPGGLDPASTTFVFVTPRPWPGKDEWAEARTAEGVWREVRAYDATDLMTWMEAAPAAHLWFAARLGFDTADAESADAWWAAWSGATQPAFPAEALTLGREDEVERLHKALAGKPLALSVAAESQEEALGFIVASLDGHPNLMHKAVVVRSLSAWKRLAVSETPLVLLPLFERPEVATACMAGHHVLVALGRETPTSSGLALPRIHRASLEAALIEAGLPRDRASDLATLGRRSLRALRRSLAVNPDVDLPEWAQPEHAPEVAPLLLVGTWMESDGDRSAVTAIVGRPYDELAPRLSRWSNVSDPLVRRIGDVWMVTAKADAWELTARALTSSDVDRFRRTATDVLSSDDPALDLPPNLRIAASLLKKNRPHSGPLLGGLADTLALLSATSDTVLLPGSWTGEALATVVVRDVLAAANGDLTGRLWISVSSVLPALAEAAPAAFLDAVDTGACDADGPVLALFQSEDGAASLLATSHHSSLLWALETVAWSPDHLAQAALRLARLSQLDPGGSTLNRPFNSLRDTLLLWRPGTAATPDERLDVIDLLRRQYPDIAWRLMLDLIPTSARLVSGQASPTYRDWKPDIRPEEPIPGLPSAVDRLMASAVADADADGLRWAALLSHAVGAFVRVLPDVLDALDTVDADSFSREGRVALFRTALAIAHRHQHYPDAEWSLSLQDTERVRAVADRFEPVSPLDRLAWLFDERGLDGFRDDEADREAQHRTHHEAQDEALRELLVGTTPSELSTWIGTFPKPDFAAMQLGHTLARVIPGDPALIDLLAGDKDAQRLGSQTIRSLTRYNGLEWAAETVHDHADWPTDLTVAFLLAVPTAPVVWDLADERGADVVQGYWSAIRPDALPWDEDIVVRAADNLIAVERPRVAIQLFDRLAYRNAEAIPLNTLAGALELAAHTATTPFDGDTVRHIGDHLNRLAEAEFDPDRLARLEWTYLPLFKYSRRASTTLHRALSADPSFFVEVINHAYPVRGDEPAEPSPAEQAGAERASALLESWRTVPGSQADGTVDATALHTWVSTARDALDDAGRLDDGLRVLGRVLRYGPAAQSASDEGPDAENPPSTDWPVESIRDLIENVESRALERGFESEVYNSRGVTTRGLTTGGHPEMSLAELHRLGAKRFAMKWPRTSAMLIRIAETFEHDGRRHDDNADLTQDTWR